MAQATADVKNNSGEQHFQGEKNSLCFLNRIFQRFCKNSRPCFLDDDSSLSPRSHYKLSGRGEKSERCSYSVSCCVCTCVLLIYEYVCLFDHNFCKRVGETANTNESHHVFTYCSENCLDSKLLHLEAQFSLWICCSILSSLCNNSWP